MKSVKHPQPDINNYNDLVYEIRRKDRRFRFFQGLFITIVLLGLICIGLLALKQLTILNEQATVRSKNLQVLIDDNRQQTEYIKCIARFFNERNRANANLTDLDQCTIQRSDGSFTPPANVPPDEDDKTSSTIFVAPSTPDQTIIVTPPEQNPSIVVPVPEIPETPAQERTPVKILGIPACVPFTDVCVRR